MWTSSLYRKLHYSATRDRSIDVVAERRIDRERGILSEKNVRKRSKIGAAAIAPWFRLRLPSCSGWVRIPNKACCLQFIGMVEIDTVIVFFCNKERMEINE